MLDHYFRVDSRVPRRQRYSDYEASAKRVMCAHETCDGTRSLLCGSKVTPRGFLLTRESVQRSDDV